MLETESELFSSLRLACRSQAILRSGRGLARRALGNRSRGGATSSEIGLAIVEQSFSILRASRIGMQRCLLLLCCLAIGLVSGGFEARAASQAFEVPDSARAEGAISGGKARVHARLLIDPAGSTADTVAAGVLFDLDPGWHIYWRNSGDTGLPTEIKWSMDAGHAGPLRWPAPTGYDEADGLFVTYGYSKQVLLASSLDVSQPSDAARTVEADIKVLVCETECIPAQFKLSRSIDEARVDSPEARPVHAHFTEYAARVPGPARAAGLEIEALYSQSGLRPGDAFQAAIAIHDCMGDAPCVALRPVSEGIAFFPYATNRIELTPTGRMPAGSENEASLLRFDGLARGDFDASSPVRLRGVLALLDEDGAPHAVEVDLPLPLVEAETAVTALGEHWLPTKTATTLPSVGLLEAIFFALIGGLILNLMPCVLPVLAIKVFAVADMAGKKRREVIGDGFAYTAGILASMAALAMAVLAMRSVGAQVGWGFQFQSPLFVAAIASVLVGFALNLFGVYEISLNVGGAANAGSEGSSTRRSFFEGLLAVVLATPCSAPFLGTAVGFAFAGSAVTIVAIFLAIGLGLALPYLLITWVPAWSRFLPRSGAWMLKLRAGLGFALLATVVWLLYVAGGLSGILGMTTLLALLVGVAFTLWLFGLAQHGARPWPVRVALLAVVAMLAFGADTVRSVSALQPSGDGDVLATTASSQSKWTKWDPAQIQASLDTGRPVLVVFSAEWCITCKVNEHVVLAAAEVVAEIERLNVELMKADWTRRDETIRAELAQYGRAGVPMYLLYHPSAPNAPVLLPELLSVSLVIDALNDHAEVAQAGSPL
jgi:thiol:disulfide interchange protein/DsbC/DsbD-like thiol-disulfide interchange protein